MMDSSSPRRRRGCRGSSTPRQRHGNGKNSSPQRHELEGKEACDWLRAAGFPQYVQLYEAGLFPINITSVRRDHEFLDHDSVRALCRRLTTLNKCAALSLEVHFQCKQSEDSEEEDGCALSSRWAFQRESKTWSRLCTVAPGDDPDNALRPSPSSDSVLSDLSRLDVTSLTSDLSLSSLSLDSTREGASPGALPSVTASQQPAPGNDTVKNVDVSDNSSSCAREKPKRTSRLFLRRMESWRRNREKETVATGVSTETNFHSNALNLGCTSDATLPGLSAKKPKHDAAKDNAWKSHTICRTNISQSEAPVQPQRACLYLEDYQLAWEKPKPKLTNHSRSERRIHLPSDHKPGTFPKSLSVESLCPAPYSESCEQIGWRDDGDLSSSESQDFLSDSLDKRRGSVGSVYDNVPAPSEGEESALEEEAAFRHLDAILQEVQGLQLNIDQWSHSLDQQHPASSGTTLPSILQYESNTGTMLPSILQYESNTGTTLPSILQYEDQSHSESESTTETTLPSILHYEDQSHSESESTTETTLPSMLHYEDQSVSGTTVSDYESAGNSLNDGEGDGEMRERRDSGFGASLTRPSRKLRWHSFQNSHRPSVSSASQEINRQSAAQLNLLHKFSLLRLTAVLEKHCDTHKHGWSWAVPKFMKRSRSPAYRDKQVFGVPPIINVQRSGQPLPQSIQQAMRYLRSQCLEKVGIFRKSGVKSRIQALRQLNENSPDHVTYQGQSAYDVADLLKQYFRDLPEPVLTSKLTETFIHIYQYVPECVRLQAVQAAVVLLPDENREVLQTLLYFLSDVASAQENQMTADSLAVCLAPSLLHLNTHKRDTTSPRLINRKGGAKPDHKDLSENMAATQCLSHMITECKKLFQVPHEMMLHSGMSYVSADAQPLPLHGVGLNARGERVGYREYLDDNVEFLLRDSAEKSKGWNTVPSPEHTDLAYKKVGDGHPIRLWRVSVEMEAPPPVVLTRVLRERQLWDEDLLHSRVIQSLEKNTEVFHYITDSMAPHPRRHFLILRHWCTDLPRGVCVIVASSVDHDDVPLEAGLRAVLLTSRILIEPCGSGRSRLTHYCRADLRGRSPEWYNKVFGQLCAMELIRIRGSFPVLSIKGPETKI